MKGYGRSRMRFKVGDLVVSRDSFWPGFWRFGPAKVARVTEPSGKYPMRRYTIRNRAGDELTYVHEDTLRQAPKGSTFVRLHVDAWGDIREE
jgi:hypothetical protein